MTPKVSGKKRAPKSAPQANGFRFEPARLESLFEVLDAVAWVESPTCKLVAQYANIDPRTAGKLLKNGVLLGVLETFDGSTYLLPLAYPYKGAIEQKQAVVREALVRMPLLKNMRQFIRMGEKYDNALRKAATVVGVEGYDPKAFAPLVAWAKGLDALDLNLDVEDLVNLATEAKIQRHINDVAKRVAFISQSSKDKPFVRKLVADLSEAGISVWLDEQRIRVGESIPERIGQGLAGADIFLLALSENSVASEWVKRELNNALVSEISKRSIKIMPLKISECTIPELIQDKKYADFTQSYKAGLTDLLTAIRSLED